MSIHYKTNSPTVTHLWKEITTCVAQWNNIDVTACDWIVYIVYAAQQWSRSNSDPELQISLYYGHMSLEPNTSLYYEKQGNLRIQDTLGQPLLSFVRRLSSLKDSKCIWTIGRKKIGTF